MAEADRALLDEIAQGAEAMGTLSADPDGFSAVVEAFRAQDPDAMQQLLEKYGLLDRCEVICRWLRSKEAVVLCLELAGPPKEIDLPDVREFASLVAKLTADPQMLELLATAVLQREASLWGELVDKNGLERFSHLLCHWVATVHYRLVCEVVCGPPRPVRPALIPELKAAGLALGLICADRDVFAAAAKAAQANDCAVLAETLGDGGFAPFCFFICEFFCSWRCLLLCLRLWRLFPIDKIDSPLDEMREFAEATSRLDKNALERLAAATLRADIDQVQSLVTTLRFERYAVQFCHWVCFLRCHWFCLCVCPPRTIGVFTRIGGLFYDTAIDSHVNGSGLTVADRRAFYSTLRLNGGLSVVDGAPLVEYRFETIVTSDIGTPTGSWTEVTAAQIAQTNIGSFIRPIGTPPFLEVIPVWINNPGPGVFNITPDADGWIAVPPMYPVAPMVSGSGWRFVPGSDLINLMTQTLTPFVGSVSETGVVAGSSANSPLQTDVHYGVRMRLRDQGMSGSGTEAGTCSHIAINNSVYEDISHHPYWPGGLFGQIHELAVASVGISELQSAPCSQLTDQLTVEFTAAHSNLGAVSAWLEGPGGPYPFDLVPAAAPAPGDNWFGTAVPAGWTFNGLAPCAYLLKLEVQVLLTTGDGVPSDLVDYIAFCKGKSRRPIG